MYVPLVYVVLTYRNTEDLELFFAHLGGPDGRVVVVNSYYDEMTKEKMEQIARSNGADFLNVENKGYGAGNNAGIAYALMHYDFDALVISNPDVEVGQWHSPDMRELRDRIVAPRIVTLSGKEQNPYYAVRNRLGEWFFGRYAKSGKAVWMWAAVIMNKLLREGFLLMTRISRRESYRVAAAHGAFLIIGREALDQLEVPLFDERMFLFCEEVHLARLARQHGVRIEYRPGISVLHKEDGSMSIAQIQENEHALRSWRVLYGLERAAKSDKMMAGRGCICLIAAIALLLSLQGCSLRNPELKRFTVQQVSIDSGWAKNSVNSPIFRRDPLAGDGTWQYVAYYDNAGQIVVGKRLLGRREWELKKTNISGGASDAHNSISMAVDGRGLLHVAFGCHCSPLQYYVSEAPGSLNLRKAELVGRDEAESTYPEFYRLRGGDLLLTYRNGAADRTALVLNRYDVRQAAWVRINNAVIETFGVLTPYWQMCVDAHDVLHLTWCWRGTRDVGSNHDLCYAYSLDGGRSWRRAGGDAYSLPITYATADAIAKVGPSQTLINQGTMACDTEGGFFSQRITGA